MCDWVFQSGNGVRLGWGPAGAGRLAVRAACLVIVDVLSFTTAVSVAVEQGIRVLPFWLPDGPATTAERAAAQKAAAVYARQSGARLAVARRAVTPDSPWSLSPAHLRRAPYVARLVLPSPNSAAIAAAPPGVRVAAACLRNITAVGSWLTARGYGTPAHPVAVIAAGERWPDGSLRPALEDLLGAGALISGLRPPGPGRGTAVRRGGCREGGLRGHRRPCARHRRRCLRPPAGRDGLRHGRGHRHGGGHLHRRPRTRRRRRLRPRLNPVTRAGH